MQSVPLHHLRLCWPSGTPPTPTGNPVTCKYFGYSSQHSRRFCLQPHRLLNCTQCQTTSAISTSSTNTPKWIQTTSKTTSEIPRKKKREKHLQCQKNAGEKRNESVAILEQQIQTRDNRIKELDPDYEDLRFRNTILRGQIKVVPFLFAHGKHGRVPSQPLHLATYYYIYIKTSHA